MLLYKKIVVHDFRYDPRKLYVLAAKHEIEMLCND